MEVDCGGNLKKSKSLVGKTVKNRRQITNLVEGGGAGMEANSRGQMLLIGGGNSADCGGICPPPPVNMLK